MLCVRVRRPHVFPSRYDAVRRRNPEVRQLWRERIGS
jgi:hypothetical protein